MELQQLPLFPLNTVLFPGTPLPLHIFEERYKQMIGACLEHKQPFGVVLIRSGREVGGPAQPREVGTTATIAALTRLEEGRMNLVALGQERFRIVELVRDRSYLIGQVAMLRDEPGKDCQEAATALTPVLSHYLDQLFASLDQPRESFTLPADPERLSYVVAAVLQIGLEEKQLLLEATCTDERLRREMEFLRRENDKLTTVLRVKQQVGTVTPLDTATLRNRISPN